MSLPEVLQQLGVADLRGIEHHQHRFRMTRLAATHFLVGGVGGMASGIAGRRGEYPGQLPEQALHAPETAHAKYRLLQVCGERLGQRVAIDVVRGGYRHWLRPAGQRRIGGGDSAFLANVEQAHRRYLVAAQAPVYCPSPRPCSRCKLESMSVSGCATRLSCLCPSLQRSGNSRATNQSSLPWSELLSKRTTP